MERSALAILLLTLAPLVHAQTVYKCVGPNGRASFSDKPCPGQVQRAQPQGEYSTDTVEACLRGNELACEVLKDRKARAELLRKSCAAGDQSACRRLAEMGE